MYPIVLPLYINILNIHIAGTTIKQTIGIQFIVTKNELPKFIPPKMDAPNKINVVTVHAKQLLTNRFLLIRKGAPMP